MQLVYLSPVPWASFAQRPHKFVDWFRLKTQDQVLWLDPYPTRFPMLSDLNRVAHQFNSEECEIPPWLKVIKPAAVPIEPLPASGKINQLFWRSILTKIDEFIDQKPTLLGIGKPSVLALILMGRNKKLNSVYDAMDDFPSFYSGYSRWAMRRRESRIVSQATQVITSSSFLKQNLSRNRNDILLIPNALDPNLPPPFKIINRSNRERLVFGYVGTMGAWFDWQWVITLAKTRAKDIIRLIGPLFSKPPHTLPFNIQVLPSCAHSAALAAMQEFDVGLIPFKINTLTASVDPIKYYEYRSLGLPVISTEFGEMRFRGEADGAFISREDRDLNSLIEAALSYYPQEATIREFIANNNWEARFNAAKIL